MAAVLADARTGEQVTGRVGQAESVIQLAIWGQPGVGGDRRAVNLQQQPPVEIEPQRTPIRFTRTFRRAS
jgi:hypothetical protein